MNENEVKPECEVYDLGMLYNAAYLVDKGLLKKPLQIQYVLGVLGGAGADIKVLQFLKQISDELFGSDQISWSVNRRRVSPRVYHVLASGADGRKR